MGPTPKEKEKIIIKAKQQMGIRMDERQIVQAKRFLFLIFIFSNFLSHIPEFLTVGFHRDKHGKCSTR